MTPPCHICGGTGYRHVGGKCTYLLECRLERNPRPGLHPRHARRISEQKALVAARAWVSSLPSVYDQGAMEALGRV